MKIKNPLSKEYKKYLKRYNFTLLHWYYKGVAKINDKYIWS